MCWIILASSVAAAEPSYEQLQTMYQTTLTQLQAAQDRKNELAKENADLQAKVTKADSDVAAAQSTLAAVRNEVAMLREQQTLWTKFLQSTVDVNQRWFQFANMPAGASEFDTILDRRWPFSVL